MTAKTTENKKSRIGTVQKFRVKPKTVSAIQFTGKNGPEIIDFVRLNGCGSRRGPNWIKVTQEFPGVDDKPMLDTVMLTRGDILVLSDGVFSSFDEERFRLVFSVTTTHELMGE